jgi:DNA-cytosine methyltransferase
MKHGSLFSGIGGFDLAAEWMGWENIFHCEWMPFPRQVLHYHFPKSISYEDITKTDFTIHRGSIDILTGGFPCQPYSSAGKRLGKDDERHLWPHMLRAIQEINPTFVVGENVRGLTNWNGGVVFEEVCAQLEDCGYKVQPILLPACAIGAPHRRDRIWFIAVNTNSSRFQKTRHKQQTTAGESKANKTYDKRYQGKSGLTAMAHNGMLPTPRVFAYKDSATDRGKSNLGEVTGAGSHLNPRFVAEMMGFPPNWTELPFQNGGQNQSKDMEMQ